MMLYLPFIIQGLCMVVDEFYFHEKRGLLKWERLGHPLDTLTVLICYSSLLFGDVSLNTYIALCVFSCLFITKDEFVHAKECTAPEQWVHSLLFILHPLCFLSAYLLFLNQDLSFLKIQTGVIFVFMIYQIFRWSISWPIRAK